MKSFPGLGVPYFEEKTSCHHNSRVLRTLFSICHTIYQVSNGECANPLHVLLADTVDTYSGSAKLSSTLNSFGIVCSKNKSRDYIDSIVNRKNLSKFIDDLNVNSFTIISIDNIDFGQPNAAVSVSPQNREIHATSYQAVQPKPSALMDLPRSSVLLHTNAVIDISSVTTSSFTLNDVEKAEVKSLDKCIFQYILEKNSIENSELLIPNLKCHLSKFKEPNTERAEVVYLGISSMDTFIKSRILKEPSVTVPVRKHVLKTFTLPIHKQKTKKVNCEHKEKMLYNRCIKKEMTFSMRSGKPLQNFRQYISLPRAICNVDGSINHQDTKSNATRHLNSRYDNIIIEKMPSGSNSDLVILEGMFIINSAPIRSHHKTFSDHMQYLIRRWILPHFKSGAKEVHILFDRPGALSQDGSPTLKDLERCRRDDKKKPADTVENIVISSQLPKGK
ncbi:unnamed protein product [Mytilus edulis]|uniref:Uncharacterized protein n=1 Tax=Mytilus edulis TaxID=6550 RepID=A0A8S3SZ81_MYTED|nr:unnamed protein product [Mytilus edulis]